jgi:hypothetical protein
MATADRPGIQGLSIVERPIVSASWLAERDQGHKPQESARFHLPSRDRRGRRAHPLDLVQRHPYAIPQNLRPSTVPIAEVTLIPHIPWCIPQ